MVGQLLVLGLSRDPLEQCSIASGLAEPIRPPPFHPTTGGPSDISAGRSKHGIFQFVNHPALVTYETKSDQETHSDSREKSAGGAENRLDQYDARFVISTARCQLSARTKHIPSFTPSGLDFYILELM